MGQAPAVTDIDECVTGSHVCHANSTCQNTIGSYNCSCHSGFTGDGKNCTDINECLLPSPPCDYKRCINEMGNYTCCQLGYRANRTIPGIEECTIQACPKPGNFFDGTVTDITNILKNLTCKPGLVWPGLKPGVPAPHYCDGQSIWPSCADADECNLNIHKCNGMAMCVNTYRSYQCTCPSAFRSNGTDCEDVDECSLELHGCTGLATCENMVGSFLCKCPPGLKKNGTGCRELNECEKRNFTCSSDAHCTNESGTFSCVCKPGFTGEGISCTDIDECARPTSGNCSLASTSCFNTPGSFACCSPGYQPFQSACAKEYVDNLLILDPVNYPAMNFSRAASLCSQLGLAIPSRTEEKDLIVQAARDSIISDFVWFRMFAEPKGLRKVFHAQATASREDLHNVACARYTGCAFGCGQNEHCSKDGSCECTLPYYRAERRLCQRSFHNPDHCVNTTLRIPPGYFFEPVTLSDAQNMCRASGMELPTTRLLYGNHVVAVCLYLMVQKYKFAISSEPSATSTGVFIHTTHATSGDIFTSYYHTGTWNLLNTRSSHHRVICAEYTYCDPPAPESNKRNFAYVNGSYSRGTAECNSGYSLQGDLPMRCQGGNRWSTVCVENSCPSPALIPNAVTTGNSTVAKNVSCLPGYTLATSSPPVIYCQTNQTWTFSACEEYTYCDPPAPESNKRNFAYVNGSYSRGTAECNSGYSLQGDLPMRCQGGNRWSTVCVENSCPSPALIPNAVTTGNSTVAKNVSCLPGYTLATSSPPVIYCQTNQTWTFSACEENSCPPLAPIPNAVTTGNSTVEKNVSCLPGYTLAPGSPPVIYCQTNQKWTFSVCEDNCNYFNVTCPQAEQCLSTSGSYTCCKLGYGLDAQGKCAQNVCGAFKGQPNTVYTRVSNVAKNVSCLPGFRLAPHSPSTIYCDGTNWTLSSCTDIDECDVQPLPCELSRCVNDVGTYQCCPLGYRKNISLPTRCGENSCPPPAPIPNAVTTGNSTVEKNVSCLPGYTLATGSPTVIYCQTNQKWTFSACEENSCPPPAPIPNAVTTGNSTVAKNVSCLPGYTLATGSPPVIYCQTNQKWTFSACEDIDECAGPTSDNCSLASMSCFNTPGSFACCSPGYQPFQSACAEEYEDNLLILDPVNYPAMNFSGAASLCSQLGLAIPSRTEEKDMIVQAANNLTISDFVWFRMFAEPFGLRRVFLAQATASHEDLHNVACARYTECASGCGQNEHCSKDGSCECTLPYYRADNGSCQRSFHDQAHCVNTTLRIPPGYFFEPVTLSDAQNMCRASGMELPTTKKLFENHVVAVCLYLMVQKYRFALSSGPSATSTGVFIHTTHAISGDIFTSYYLSGQWNLLNTRSSHHRVICAEYTYCDPPAPESNKRNFAYVNGSYSRGTAECNSGYRLQGDLPMRCQGGNRWSTACVENSCPPPAPIPNAVTTGKSTVEKTVSCLPGYTLAPGSPPVIYCQTNQKWTLSACEDIDECDVQPLPCELSRCVNDVGTYQCCPLGYRKNISLPTRCEENVCGAFKGQPNTVYTRVSNVAKNVSCLPGFRLAPRSPSTIYCDGTNWTLSYCTDIDECDVQPLPCELSRCVNDVGTYQCCPLGYRKNISLPTRCEDIDECDVQPLPCELSRCVNDVGTYQCCPLGYRKNISLPTRCEENVCGAFKGQPNTVYTRVSNVAKNVSCLPGFRLAPRSPSTIYCDGTNWTYSYCTDIDECNVQPLPCELSRCVNDVGTYQCCPLGYRKNISLPTRCEENVCGALKGQPNAVYTRVSNVAKNVSCLPGFRLAPHSPSTIYCDGTNWTLSSCTDINECRVQPLPCELSRCVNDVGTYQCCPLGYRRNRTLPTRCGENSCPPPAPIPNAVTTGNSTVEKNVSCLPGYTLAPGSPPVIYCQTNQKWTFSVCEDVDECSNAAKHCQVPASCSNTMGSYTCTCASGVTGCYVDLKTPGKLNSTNLVAPIAGSIAAAVIVLIVVAFVVLRRRSRRSGSAEVRKPFTLLTGMLSTSMLLRTPMSPVLNKGPGATSDTRASVERSPNQEAACSLSSEYTSVYASKNAWHRGPSCGDDESSSETSRYASKAAQEKESCEEEENFDETNRYASPKLIRKEYSC
ncbi:fibrillin-2-like [Sycon ciliatum]|uniref:fibrillin-2-like n=1 Tax=Sycon ciliatum TaxID=27933 RepID=UPI0031F65069